VYAEVIGHDGHYRPKTQAAYLGHLLPAMAPTMTSETSPNSPAQSGWLAVAAVTLAAFAFVTTEFLPIGLLPQITGELHLKTGVGGLMVTTTGLVAAMAAPLTTLLAGRLDRRNVLLLLSILLMAANLVAASATGFATMLAARALLGVALGGFWAVALAAAGRLVRPEKAALATATLFAGITLATIVGVPLGTLIGTVASWRFSFLATGALVFVALVAQFFLLPRLPSDAAVKTTDFGTLLRRPSSRLSLIMMAVVIAAHFTAYTFIAPFLLDHAGFDERGITAVLLGFGVAGFIGNFLAPKVIARDLRWSLVATMVLLGATIFALPLLAATHAGASVDILCWGMAYGALPVALSVWVQRYAADLPEASSALFVMTYQIAIAAGSFAGGRAVDGAGVVSALLLGGAAVVVALVLLARFGGRKVTDDSAAPNGVQTIH
jgi:predicted MFS family arabinose efflux permease